MQRGGRMIVPSVAGRFVYQLIDRPFLDVVSYIVSETGSVRGSSCRHAAMKLHSRIHRCITLNGKLSRSSSIDERRIEEVLDEEREEISWDECR